MKIGSVVLITGVLISFVVAPFIEGFFSPSMFPEIIVLVGGFIMVAGMLKQYSDIGN
jgi:uncharacterized membrane protein SpoIIM required for sporulation